MVSRTKATVSAWVSLISALLQLHGGVVDVHHARDQQAEHEVEQPEQQHALELASGLVDGDAAKRGADVHVAHGDGQRAVFGEVEKLRDQRRDDDPQRLRQDHEVHRGAGANAERVGGLGLALADRENAAAHDLGDEGAGVERERQPQRDQRVAQVQAAVEKTVAEFGRLDIVVNNAGTSAGGNFETVDDAAWQHDMDLKFFAAIRFSRLAIPHMKAVGGGRIINVTNLGGKQPGPNSVPTSVSRAAGIALTKALSKDLATHNILVNTVCIGLIKSGQHERRIAQMQNQDLSASLDNFYSERGQNVPLGRVGEAQEAGDVICFLASERASYLTGTSINIDGGTSGAI